MKTIISVSDFVMFRQGLYRDEKETIYRVLEVNGDRCILELVNTTMQIRPQSIARVAELEVLTEDQLIHSVSYGSLFS